MSLCSGWWAPPSQGSLSQSGPPGWEGDDSEGRLSPGAWGPETAERPVRAGWSLHVHTDGSTSSGSRSRGCSPTTGHARPAAPAASVDSMSCEPAPMGLLSFSPFPPAEPTFSKATADLPGPRVFPLPPLKARTNSWALCEALLRHGGSFSSCSGTETGLTHKQQTACYFSNPQLWPRHSPPNPRQN